MGFAADPSMINPVQGAAGAAGGAKAGVHGDTAAAQSLLASWRENLAMLGANADPGSEALVTQMGDRLWTDPAQVGGLF